MNAYRSITTYLATVALGLTCASALPAEDGIADDRMTVTFIGTGSPRINLERSGPSVMVEAGGRRFLVDVGPGARDRIYVAGGFDLISDIDYILLTHLHYDHIANVPDIWIAGWLYGRSTPLIVQGPTGTERSLGHLQQAGELFTRTKPRMAVYSHIIPPETTPDELIGYTRPHYDGPVTVAHDLMEIKLRGDSEIIVGERKRTGTVSYHNPGQ